MDFEVAVELARIAAFHAGLELGRQQAEVSLAVE
jgi:hypothetical protein